MKKQNDDIAKAAVNQLAQNVEENLTQIGEQSEKQGLNIDYIEEMLGKLKKQNSDAVDKLYSDLIEGISEKELIRKKKQN
jgi:hypothetical protein